MEIIRHIVSGPSSSMCLVHLGDSFTESKRNAHLRAVFQTRHWQAEGRVCG